ncbi:hypothetical protein DFJ74DRAFT_700036 [Hyaloraphidium curvatum]|nr:hypothetical protein DFJ74DRAFT_700036 [Hyaloraphidium curvatum]
MLPLLRPRLLLRRALSRAHSTLPLTIAESLLLSPSPAPISVQGWARSLRAQKSVSFLELSDGSSLAALQCVLPGSAHVPTGASVRVTGRVVESRGRGQGVELKAEGWEILGDCDAAVYPLAKAKMGADHLREHMHLRTRTRTFAAAWRFRDAVVRAIHRYFEDNGFVHIHAPLITSLDCEGGGEVFSVSRPPAPGQPPDFFGAPAYLTVSAQLHLEMACCGSLPRVYALGPAFRAEPAHTARHLAEFWMLEAEVAFVRGLEDVCVVAEGATRAAAAGALERCSGELEHFERMAEEGSGSGKGWLTELVRGLAEGPYARMSYTDAVEVLRASGRDFFFPVEWGRALQTEHEKFLAEEVCRGPVFVTDYPIGVKPFYMRANGDADVAGATDAELLAGRVTVACTDLLLPRIGELVGGSVREERADRLEPRMRAAGLLEGGQYDWYLDLRRFGTVPHGGFGLGLERLLMYLTGTRTARDVVLAPRYAGSCRY